MPTRMASFCARSRCPIPARLVARDPLAFAGRARRHAVQALRDLQRDVWPIGKRALEEPGMALSRLIRQNIRHDFDAGTSQFGDAGPIGARIGILNRDDDARARLRSIKRVRAGRRVRHRRAGLERDIGRGTTRQISCGRERVDFGVRPAAVGRASARDHATLVRDDDTSH